MEEPGAEGDSSFGGVATGMLTKLQWLAHSLSTYEQH